jgi:hypothetical protein
MPEGSGMSSSNVGGFLQGHGVGITEEELAAPESELIKVHSGDENSPDDIRPYGLDTKELTFRGDQFTYWHLDELKQFSDVRSLTLLDSTKITGDALEHLPASVENLELRGCDEIKDSDLDKLPRTLQSLILSGGAFTDAGLQYLPHNLQSLTLSGGMFTNAGLQHLRHNLHGLSLFGDEFTDAGLQYLPPNLHTLLLDGEEFTDVGLQRLPQDLQELSL